MKVHSYKNSQVAKKSAKNQNSKHSSCEFSFSPQADAFIRTNQSGKVKSFFKYFRGFRDNIRSGRHQNTTGKSQKRATKVIIEKKNHAEKIFARLNHTQAAVDSTRPTARQSCQWYLSEANGCLNCRSKRSSFFANFLSL